MLADSLKMVLVQVQDLAQLVVEQLLPKEKRNHQEAVLTDIQQLTKKLSDSADGIRTDTERAITRLFSPSPTMSDLSVPAVAVEHAITRLFSPSPTMSDLSGPAVAVGTSAQSSTLRNYNSAKEGKLIVERKIMCIEKHMDYHKYVISSDFLE